VKPLETLGPDQLRDAMLAYRDVLRSHQDRLNRLNVYPVPDGDTGTNMALTLESVVAGLMETDTADAAVAKVVTHGSLMGARGNSGVILSQILKGLAGGLGGATGPVGAEGVAAALLAASRAADLAVMHPVEGTILTVARDAAAAAHGDTVVAVLEAARAAAAVSLDDTPKLLAVLAEAGVVDAGGAGFVLLLDALLHVTDGRPLPEAPEPLAPSMSAAGDGPDNQAGNPEGGRYEVMYFLETADEEVDGFKRAWDAIGDSIVVVGGEGLWNCHIHTDDIGAAVEAAIDAGGRPRQIRVTDLHQQVADEAHHREVKVERQQVVTAVVAVAAGAGVVGILRSLGVQEVVTGGQSMNPSTAQIVDAIDATDAESVIVLPNNKNVIPVAEKAAGLGAKPVRVVATRSVAEGLASLLAYDAAAEIDVNAAAMLDAATRVAWGEVTQAVRDAAGTPAGPVKDGDWLGLDHGSIAVVGADLADAACRLLERLLHDHHEIITVIEGEGATEAATSMITDWLAGHRPGVAAEVHKGGQPLSAYLFSVE